MLIAGNWEDYELLDAGSFERLDRWGAFIVRRPEPVASWPRTLDESKWHNADLIYVKTGDDGKWVINPGVPERWIIRYGRLAFYVRPSGMKQLGLFPEQTVNWDWIISIIRAAGQPVRVLNLFAYTGGSTLAAASAGASVCHVDASRTFVNWARDNLSLSGLGDRPVRFIVDDALRFTQREGRRGSTYDAIILDPPSFGRGPRGEVWKIEKHLPDLLDACARIMSSSPLFLLLTFHTTGISPRAICALLDSRLVQRYGGRLCADELGVKIAASCRVLASGTRVLWEGNTKTNRVAN